MKQPNINDLTWIRIHTPIHIPDYLIEQVRDRDYSVEDFKKYQHKACVMLTEKGYSLNPLNHLHILIDNESLTKGFVWFTVNSLSKDIYINTFSMDKDYWYKGKAVEKLANYIKEIRRKATLNKIIWTTNYPKHSLRYGFKQCKATLMEYTEEEDGQDTIRGSNTRREHRPSNSSTTTISGRNPRTAGIRATSGTGLQSVSTAV